MGFRVEGLRIAGLRIADPSQSVLFIDFRPEMVVINNFRFFQETGIYEDNEMMSPIHIYSAC